MVRRLQRRGVALACGLALGWTLSASPAASFVLIDGSTPGYYNAAIGTSLDGSNPASGTFLFPGANLSNGDPTFNPVPYEPDLSPAATALGDWLGDPGNLNGNWSGPQPIPATWAVNTETAIVYEIDAGAGGLEGIQAGFGVDNGLYVWLDGTFLNGWMAPGGAFANEYVLDIGSLSGGTHTLQILREDHGGATGYAVQVTAELKRIPEPRSIAIFGAALVGVGMVRRRGKRGAAA